MKYLKTYESNDFYLKSDDIIKDFKEFRNYIDDLFIDLKDDFTIKGYDIEYEAYYDYLISIKYNTPPKLEREKIDEEDLIFLIKQSERLKKLYLELNKILKTCGCNYFIKIDEGLIEITFCSTHNLI